MQEHRKKLRADAVRLYADGWTLDAIGASLGLSRSAVWRWVNPEKVKPKTRTIRERLGRALYSSQQQAKAKGYAACVATVDELLEMDYSSCAICGRTDGRICLDHCHDSGRFRGWLCVKCNCGLGNFEDNPARLRRAIKYLSNSKD